MPGVKTTVRNQADALTYAIGRIGPPGSPGQPGPKGDPGPAGTGGVAPKATPANGAGSTTTHATPGTSKQVTPANGSRVEVGVWVDHPTAVVWLGVGVPAVVGQGPRVTLLTPWFDQTTTAAINCASSVASVPVSFLDN